MISLSTSLFFPLFIFGLFKVFVSLSLFLFLFPLSSLYNQLSLHRVFSHYSYNNYQYCSIVQTVYTTADSYIPDGNGGGHIGGGQIGGGLGLGSIIGGGSQWSHHKQWSSSWQSGSHSSIGGRIIERGHGGIIGEGQGGIIGGGQGEIIGGGHGGIIGTGQGGIIGEGQGGIIKQKGCGPYGCGHYRRK